MSDQGIWDQSYPPSLWAPPDPPEESPARTPTGARAGASGKAQSAEAPQTLEEAPASEEEPSEPQVKRTRRKAEDGDS